MLRMVVELLNFIPAIFLLLFNLGIGLTILTMVPNEKKVHLLVSFLFLVLGILCFPIFLGKVSKLLQLNSHTILAIVAVLTASLSIYYNKKVSKITADHKIKMNERTFQMVAKLIESGEKTEAKKIYKYMLHHLDEQGKDLLLIQAPWLAEELNDNK